MHGPTGTNPFDPTGSDITFVQQNIILIMRQMMDATTAASRAAETAVAVQMHQPRRSSFKKVRRECKLF